MAMGQPNVKSVNALTKPEKRLTSFVLILFTMAVATVCIILLASTLTQSRLSFSIDGAQITVRKLDAVAQEWGRHRFNRDQGRTKLETALKNEERLTDARTKAEEEFDRTFNEVESLLVNFNLKIEQPEPELYKLLFRKGHDVQINRIQDEKERLIAAHAGLGDLIRKIENAYKPYPGQRQRRTETRGAADRNSKEVKKLQASLQEAESGLQKSFDLIKPKLETADRLRIESAFYELNVPDYTRSFDPTNNFLRRISSRISYNLVTLQPDLLTLLLVIFMGVLGSALQITHTFFIRGEASSIGRYFQRISVGALTALVIFIVAKAGIPIIAEPSRLTGDASVNPYFVSFLAILSGLLSENAITNVQAQGARLFGQTAGTARWARADVFKDFTTQQLSLDRLARQLGIEPAVIETKLKGEQEMNAGEQEVVSLYLRREPRDLFTDIPPPK